MHSNEKLLKQLQNFSACATGLKAGVNEILDWGARNTDATSTKLMALSDHTELHSAGFTDHVLIPRRIPNELHLGLIDPVYAENLALRIVRDRRSHSATGCGQRHFHFDARSAIFAFDQTTIVHQTKIDDVNRDLGVVTLPELIPDVVL